MTEISKPSDRARALGDFLAQFLNKMGELQPGAMTLNELRVGNTVLRLLRRGEECTFTRVAELTGIPNGTVSRAIAKQIERGRIRESVDGGDRRKRNLELTESGERLMTEWAEWIDQVSEHISIDSEPRPKWSRPC